MDQQDRRPVAVGLVGDLDAVGVERWARAAPSERRGAASSRGALRAQPRLPFATPLRYGPPRRKPRPGMAHTTTPHFHNTEGLKRDRGGLQGVHVRRRAAARSTTRTSIIDMGKDNEIVCPYCSTLYVFNPTLAPGTSQPLSAVYHAEARLAADGRSRPHHLHRRSRHRGHDAGAGARQVRRDRRRPRAQQEGAGGRRRAADQPQCAARAQPARARQGDRAQELRARRASTSIPFRAETAAGDAGARRRDARALRRALCRDAPRRPRRRCSTGRAGASPISTCCSASAASMRSATRAASRSSSTKPTAIAQRAGLRLRRRRRRPFGDPHARARRPGGELFGLRRLAHDAQRRICSKGVLAPDRTSCCWRPGYHAVCYPLPHRKQFNIALFAKENAGAARPASAKEPSCPGRPCAPTAFDAIMAAARGRLGLLAGRYGRRAGLVRRRRRADRRCGARHAAVPGAGRGDGDRGRGDPRAAADDRARRRVRLPRASRRCGGRGSSGCARLSNSNGFALPSRMAVHARPRRS